MLVSTRNLVALPDVNHLRALLQSLANVGCNSQPRVGIPLLFVQFALVEGRADARKTGLEMICHQPLTKALIQQLNPEVSLKELAPDIREIGYPAK